MKKRFLVTFIIGEIITVVIMILNGRDPHSLAAGILFIRVKSVALLGQGVAEPITR